MNPIGGLNKDNTPIDVPSGSWIRCKNMLLSKGYKAIECEPGFTSKFVEEIGYYIIGVIPIPDGFVILSTNNTKSRITLYNSIDDSYNIIVDTSHFDFNTDYPIEGIFKYNSLGDLIIVIGGLNVTPRILNLTTFYPVDSLYEFVNSSDANLTKLFPDSSIPDITVSTVNDGNGSLRPGMYYFAVCYCIDDYNDTFWSAVSKPIFITKTIKNKRGYTPIEIESIDYDITSDNILINKSITLTIDNLDLRYGSFKLAVIREVKQVRDAFYIGKYYINSSSQIAVYSGVHLSGNILNDILLSGGIYFDYGKTLTSFQDRAVFCNLKKSDINYQKYANNIEVSFSAEPIYSSTPYSMSIIFHRYRTFMPDEVYAFYIAPILKNGMIDRWYHIPGRMAAQFDINYGGGAANYVWEDSLMSSLPIGATRSPSTEELQINSGNAKYFQLRDTSHNHSNLPYRLGFWENTNEYYPQTGEDSEVWTVDLSGNGIRDLNYVDTKYGTILKYKSLQDDGSSMPVRVRHHKMPSIATLESVYSGGTGNIRAVCLSFSNILVPNDLVDKISGFVIGYAERTMTNMSVLAYCPNLTEDWWAGTDLNNIRTYDFGLLTDRPTIAPTYMKHAYTSSYTSTAPPRDINSVTLYGTPNFANSIQRIETIEYIEQNNMYAPNNNADKEAYIRVVPVGNNMFPNDFTNNYVEIISLNNYVEDMYYPYNQCNIVSTGYNLFSLSVGINSIGNVYGGDTCINHTNFFMIVNSSSSPYETWYLNFYNYSPYNVSLRQRRIGEDWGSYVPSGAAGSPIIPYIYDKTFNALNDVKSGLINTFNSEFLSDFPNMGLMSNVSTTEGLSENWRIYNANSYFIIDKSKGEIWKIDSNDKILFIHCKYSLLIAGIKEILSDYQIGSYLGELANITGIQGQLGVAEILDRKPKDVMYDRSGMLGCQSQYAVINCKHGHIFVDRLSGKIYNLSSGLEDLSSIHLSNYFRDNLQTTNVNIDNPFMGVGLVLGYDELNDRLILCKRDYSTYSFNYPSYLDHDSYLCTMELVGGIPKVELSSYYRGEFSSLSGLNFDEYDIIKYNGAYYEMHPGIPTVDKYIISAEYGFTVGGGDGYGIYLDILTFDLSSNKFSDYTFDTNSINCITLSYSFIIKKWICDTHSYYPHYSFNNRFGLYHVCNDDLPIPVGRQIYLANNELSTNLFFYANGHNHYEDSYIDLVFSVQPTITKELNAVTWITEVINKTTNVILSSSTVSKILVYNDTQSTGLVLVNLSTDWFNKESGRGVHDTWFFNEIRDYVVDSSLPLFNSSGEPDSINIDKNKKNWYDFNKFVGKYFIVRFVFSYFGTTNINNRMILHDFNMLAVRNNF